MRLKPDKAKRGPGAVGPQKKYEMSFLLHYVGDFHTLGPRNSKLCQHNLDKTVNLDTCIEQFRDWGISFHPDKLEGPPLSCLF